MAARTTRSTLRQDWLPQPGDGFSLDTELGHAFYQERFGLFAKLLFVVVGGFYILGNLLAAERLEGHWALVGHVSFGGVLLVLGATWLVCRRARLSLAQPLADLQAHEHAQRGQVLLQELADRGTVAATGTRHHIRGGAGIHFVTLVHEQLRSPRVYLSPRARSA